MARPVDPERRRARRLQILDAAVTCFAAHGYERTTTAEICRTAGISSGSLFHHFPAKAAIMTAIFVEDTAQIEAFFAALDPHADPLEGVVAYVDRALDEAADPRVPGLVAAVLGHSGDADFAVALAANEAAARTGLRALLERATPAALPPDRIAGWVLLLIDGFYGRILSDPAFDVAAEGDVLRRLVRGLLGPGMTGT